MQWAGKCVLIIGAARQGTALARYLAEAGAEVILNDQASMPALSDAHERLADFPVRWVMGGHPLDLLDEIDLVCPSGGVPLTLPLIGSAVEKGIPLTNDSQIFLDEVPAATVGITGSAGKTTTTALLGQIASQVYRTPDNPEGEGPVVWVGGNIGNPLITDLDRIQSEDLAILELSSFQLELMDRSPNTAVVLNITPNHLDRHGTMEAYTAAKQRILEYQIDGDTAVLNRDDPGSWGLRDGLAADLVSFGLGPPADRSQAVYVAGDTIVYQGRDTEEALLPLDSIRLRGQHNVMNVLAAAAVAVTLKIPKEQIRAGVESFVGLPHRLEFVRRWGGADWYNDSIATAPERTIAALRSFDAPIILMAGGRDKDLPWNDLAVEISQRVDHLITFGEVAQLIAEQARRAQTPSNPISIKKADTLEEAVGKAAKLVQPGDIVLLAPGGTSFDEFVDFEDRGEKFKSWVNNLS